MLASVHVADVGPRDAVGVLRTPPKPGAVPGLRHPNVAVSAPLSASVLPPPAFGRVALIAFWDDDASLEGFLDGHPLAARLAGGWRVRLAPLRAHGSWPGLSDDVPAGRVTDYDGLSVVLTFGRLRLTQAARFLRASAQASGRAVEAPGMLWGTAFARPPFVATCSLWESTRALSTYAYGHVEPAHADAIAQDRSKPFHHQSAFVRFRPYQSEGHLDGKNPLAQTWMASTSSD
jgi:hypothetical protein